MRRTNLLFLLCTMFLALVLGSCSMDNNMITDAPTENEQDPSSGQETADTMKGTWTCVTDPSRTLTFTDETFFKSTDGTVAYIDPEKSSWFIGNGYLKGKFIKDSFNCIYLEDLGYFHKDGTSVIEDSSASLIGGMWELEDGKYYMFIPYENIYYFYTPNNAGDECGTGNYSIDGNFLTLHSSDGKTRYLQIRKSFGKMIVGDCVIATNSDIYKSVDHLLRSFEGSYGHPGFYHTVDVDSYGLIRVGERLGIVTINGRDRLRIFLVDDILDYSSFLYPGSMELVSGEKPAGSTVISSSFSGKWKYANEEWRIDSSSGYAEYMDGTYLLRQEGDRLYAYGKEDLQMKYVLRIINGSLYCINVFPANNLFDPSSELQTPIGPGFSYDGQWNSGTDPDPGDPGEEVSITGVWSSDELLMDYEFHEDGTCLYPDGQTQKSGRWTSDSEGKISVYDSYGSLHSTAAYSSIDDSLTFSFISSQMSSVTFFRSSGQSSLADKLVDTWFSNTDRLYVFNEDGSVFGDGFGYGTASWKCLDDEVLFFDAEGQQTSRYTCSATGETISLGNYTLSRYSYPSSYMVRDYVDAFAPNMNYLHIDENNVATIRMNRTLEFRVMAYPTYNTASQRLTIRLYTMTGDNAGNIYVNVSGRFLTDSVIYCNNMPYLSSSPSLTIPVVLVEESLAGEIRTVEEVYRNEQTGNTVKLTEDGKITIPGSGENSYFIISDKLYYKTDNGCVVTDYDGQSLVIGILEYGIYDGAPDYKGDPALLGIWHNQAKTVHYRFVETGGKGYMYKGGTESFAETYRFTIYSEQLHYWEEGNYKNSNAFDMYSVSGDSLTIDGTPLTRCTCDNIVYRIEPSSIAEIAGIYVKEIIEDEYIDMIEIFADGTSMILYGDDKHEVKFTIEDGKLKTYIIQDNYREDASDYCYMTNKGLYFGGVMLTRKAP